MAEVPNFPFFSVQWLMDKTGQSRTEMLSQTLPGLEIPIYGDARGRECFGFPESYSEHEAWDIVFFELRTSKKHVFQKVLGDGNPAADSWVKKVFISRNDVNNILKALNLLELPCKTAPQKQDGSEPKPRKPRSDVRRVTDTIRVWESIRALRKGMTVEEIIRNLPSAKDIAEESQRNFNYSVSESTCRNVVNAIEDNAEDLKKKQLSAT